LVSVVLPTYNRRQVVGKAIQSVLQQTYTRLELLVVDDASTDGTDQLVQQIDDPRISYLRHENNRGGGAARNTGLDAARGSFIGFQDSDDEWLPHKLSTQLERLSRAPESVGAVYGPHWLVGHDGSRTMQPEHPLKAPRGDIHRALLGRNYVDTPTLLIRRVCWERCGGFDESLPRFQDWEWMIRISREWSVAYIAEPLVLSGLSPDGITDGHSPKLIEAERKLLEKHLDTFAAAGPEVLAYRWWHLAHVSFMQGSMRSGRQALRRAITTQFRLPWIGSGLLSLIPPAYRATYKVFKKLNRSA
jgi:glycosyltransferase involved in cell wall biosynthesis